MMSSFFMGMSKKKKREMAKNRNKRLVSLATIADDCDIVLLDNCAVFGYITLGGVSSEQEHEIDCIRKLSSIVQSKKNIYLTPGICREFLCDEVKDYCASKGTLGKNLWNARMDLYRKFRTGGLIFDKFASADNYVGCMHDMERSSWYKDLSGRDRSLLKTGYWTARTGKKTAVVTQDGPIVNSWITAMENGEMPSEGVPPDNYFMAKRRGAAAKCEIAKANIRL